ncbi:MAG: alpha beta-hydrolase [Trebouxia sp. A1-2]|nr:MAG: alpha beta-hydrolase [Trebouxia sp. A1-2]
MFVAWDEIMDFTFLTGMREAKLASPPWLAHLASDAQVEVNCLRVFQAFVDPQDGETDLKSLIKHTIGDVNPRRVVCVGFCAAGSVTTLTAAWAAVQWPAADVRCISFGAPAVGNTAFAASFKWLVGISYRVMFRRDPVPTALAATGLKHVHGAVYLCGKSMKLGSQSKGQIAPIADLGDHAFTGYSGALYATCKVQSDRERATEGACRAKLDTHSSFSGSSLRSSSLRSEGSLGRDSTVSLTETIDSLDNGDDEEAGITSKQPTGLMAYVRSGASNLFVDTLTVSKLAVASAFTKFGKLIPRSKPKGPSGDNTAACGHEGLAAEQSARLANGDGLLAEDDAYLISGEPPSIGKAAYSPGDSTAGVSHGEGSNPDDVPMHLEMGSEPQLDVSQSAAAATAAALASADSSSMSSDSLSNKMVTAVMLDKRLASLDTGSASVSRELMQATRYMQTDTDRHNIVKDASQQVNNLGMAAIAVNEAEVSLGEVRMNVGAEEVPGPLAPGVSLPERVIDDSIPGDFQDVQGAGASLGPADIPAEEGLDMLMQQHDTQVLVMGKISQAAIVAGAAYRNEDTFKLQTGIPKTRLIKDKVHHDTKVHVGWLEGGTAVFAFRGTASRQDGLQDVKIFSRNIDYLQELYPGVKAHMGFMQQFAAVCNPEKPETNMAAVLKELSGGQIPNRVICTGHSLGGALATLGAAWAALEYPDADIRCITFGSPRVANKVFGKAFNALVGTSLRLVHGFDPVPSLPPSLMYKHVPGVIHIRRDDLLLKHRPWHTMLRSSVTDHGMRKYSMGIYKHMPGGLEAHVAFFAVRPVARLCDKVTQAAQRATGMGGQEEQDEAQGNTKEYAEDVISPTSKAKAAGSKKGRHIRSHSSSLDWMYAGSQPEAPVLGAGSADTAARDSVANPQSVSAAAIERMYGIKPVSAA